MRILGVLAGRDAEIGMIKRWAETADRIVAADSGAHAVMELNLPIHTVVGDFDSLEIDLPNDVIRQPFEDQDFSDCDKLLAVCHEMGATCVALAGVEGDRVDHMLGTLSSVASAPFPVLLALRTAVAIVVPAQKVISTPTRVGDRISLMPLGSASGVDVNGVQWPLRNANLSFGQAVSLSNVATSESVEVRIEHGSALLFVPHRERMEEFWNIFPTTTNS